MGHDSGGGRMRGALAAILFVFLFAATLGPTATADPAAGDAPAIAGLTCLGKNEQHRYEYRHEATGIVFVLIPPGEFWMGSPDDEPYRKTDERRHRVRITKPYLIGKYEVTNAQFRKHFRANHNSEEYYNQSLNGGSQPVVKVNWLDATELCKKLGCRLPTEAEWEWAARGGEDKSVFPWGTDWPPPAKAGNFDDATGRAQLDDHMYSDGARAQYPDLVLPASYDDGFAVTSPVGSFPPNGYGLHDMAGNVWEWCGDGYGEESYASAEVAVDPMGPSLHSSAVLRGGSWCSSTRRDLRCSRRIGNGTECRRVDLGFRVVLAAGTK